MGSVGGECGAECGSWQATIGEVRTTDFRWRNTCNLMEFKLDLSNNKFNFDINP